MNKFQSNAARRALLHSWKRRRTGQRSPQRLGEACPESSRRGASLERTFL